MDRRRKTTFMFEEGLRRRLKAAAARSGRTVTDLLVEGAELVLASEERKGDRGELTRRAKIAREKLRAGLYDGPGISDRVDQLLYAAEPKRSFGRK
jgi:hypothetical protein